MATTIRLDGDATNGWMGEVHHDNQLTTHSPPGATFLEALTNMIHAQFGDVGPAPQQEDHQPAA
jgi:hypothetical protein